MSVDSKIIRISEIVSIKVCSPTCRGILLETTSTCQHVFIPEKKIDTSPQRSLLVKHQNACMKVQNRLNHFSDRAQLILVQPSSTKLNNH